MWKKLIEKLLCMHKWQVHETVRIFETPEAKYPVSSSQVLICEHCGKIKQIKLF